ncbi:MAG: hypothetical protein M3N18_00060 [Actinomycetota bacterium]|nr:hypothetical protein [Actinomycetota bacterium]
MVEVIERVAGRYEAQDVEFGRVYSWCPETVLVECDCGKRSVHKRMEIASGFVITCECGQDHTGVVRDELNTRLLERDEAIHPWRYWRTPEGTGLPF